jgi:hypothetical protein
MRFLVYGVPRRCTFLERLFRQVSGKNVRNAMRSPALGAGARRRSGGAIKPLAKVVNARGSLWFGGELL